MGGGREVETEENSISIIGLTTTTAQSSVKLTCYGLLETLPSPSGSLSAVAQRWK